MNAQETYEKVEKSLQEHRQSHLLAFWEQLDADQRLDLLAQIQRLELAKTGQWMADLVKKPTSSPNYANFTPATSYSPDPTDPEQQGKYAKAIELGKELISTG